MAAVTERFADLVRHATAFDRAGPPGRGQAVGDCVEVLLQALGERFDAGQAGVAGGVDPLREVLAGEAAGP